MLIKIDFTIYKHQIYFLQTKTNKIKNNFAINKIFDTNDLDINFTYIKNGIIDSSFKGIEDELNKSLFFTYNNFEQYHSKLIKQLIKRNVKTKELQILKKFIIFFFVHIIENIYKEFLD